MFTIDQSLKRIVQLRIPLLLVCFLLVTLVGSYNAYAQSIFYVRAGATGAGNGSDWNNAYSSLPGSLVRGATYYIADGSYGSYTFDDAHSGTTLITIIKATLDDHGTNSGWDSSYGDGEAVFGSFYFTRGYYTINGQTGGGPGSWESGFGIVVNGSVSMEKFVYNNPDRITLTHININGGATGPGDSRGMELWGSNYFTLDHVYLHDVGCDLISMNAMNNFTIQYSKLARNHQAEPGCHGDLIEYQVGDASNFVIRWNFFEDIVGSYAFGSHGPTINGYYIYGNIFYWTIEPFFGNGLVGTLSGGGTLNNLKFYNNTLSGALSGNSGIIGLHSMGGGTGAEARNNIWHRSSGTGYYTGLGATHSNNTAYNAGTGADAEEKLTGNPFNNSSNRDFTLKAASTSGTTLPSPYNTDQNGNTRGFDGNWDRGALEFGAGGGQPPTSVSTPAGLRIIIP